MSTHDIAEAEGHLRDLIDRARSGEPVVITRQGVPVAELRGVLRLPEDSPKRSNREAMAWLEANRTALPPGAPDPVALACRMRDDDWP